MTVPSADTTGEREHAGLQRREQQRRRGRARKREPRVRGHGLAVDVDGTVAQQRPERVEVLAHVTRRAVVRQPVRLLDGHAVREPDPEHQPRSGRGVDRERLRRQRHRMPRVGGDHRRAELHPAARVRVSRPTRARTVSASNPKLCGSHTDENPRPATSTMRATVSSSGACSLVGKKTPMRMLRRG